MGRDTSSVAIFAVGYLGPKVWTLVNESEKRAGQKTEAFLRKR